MIRIVAIETIRYDWEFPEELLEAVAGITLAEAGSTEALVQAAYEVPGGHLRDAFQRLLERHGEVQGQQWSAS